MHAEFVVENDVVRALVPGEGDDRAGGCAKMRWVLEMSRDALLVELVHRKLTESVAYLWSGTT